MIVTPDIIRCELIGTEVKIVKCSDQHQVGIRGRILDETRNTLTILHKGRRKIFAKNASVFRLIFSDSTLVEIDGKLLSGRPEDRLKKTIRRLW